MEMDHWYNTGGFLSSSNLSASAQPFMVDSFRVNTNPGSSMDLNEPLVDYHGKFPPAAWVNSYAPSTTLDWSAHNYAVGSEKVVGTWDSVAAVYHPASDALRTDAPRALSCYSPYVQPGILLGNHMMDATEQVPDKVSAPQAPKFDRLLGHDYTTNLLDLEGNPNLGGSWSGLEFRVPVNEGELDGNHCTGNAKAADYTDQESHASKDLRPPGEASHSINTVGWDKHFGYPSSEHADGESALAKDFMSMPGGLPDSSLHLGKHQSPCSTLAWNSIGQHGSLLDPVQSSPIEAIQPCTGSSSSAIDQDSVMKNKGGNDAVANMHFAATPFSGVREVYPMWTSEGTRQFDFVEHGTQLGSNIHGTEKQSLATDDLSNQRHVSGDGPCSSFPGKTVNCGPQLTLHQFDLALNRDHAGPCYNGSDHFHRGVDSPCWRGVQVSPPLAKVSGAADFSCMKESNGLNPQEPHVFPYDADCPVKAYYQEENNKFCVGEVPKPDFIGIFDGWQKSSGTAVIGCNDSKELQFSAGMHEKWKQSALCDFAKKSSSNSYFQHQEPTQQESCEFGSDKTQAFDVHKNINNLKNAPLEVPLHSVEHVSSTSKVDVPQKKIKCNSGVLIPRVDVHGLVSTIHNLSELLLIYGSNGVCDLGEEDHEILKKVVSNISALQNDGEMTANNDVRRTVRRESPKSEECASLHYEDSSHCKLSIDSGCKDEANAAHFPSWDRGDVARNDDMTQAIERILGENFHDVDESHQRVSLFKNLWLEAEAKLCCITYKERFSRAKVELERLNSLERKDPPGNSLEVENTTMSSINSSIEDIEPHEGRLYSNLGISTEGTYVTSANGNVNDVLARFKILTGQFDGSSTVDPVDTKLECSKSFPDLNRDNRLVSRGCSESFSYLPRDLPVTKASGESYDVDASVMARMEILKRNQNLILNDMKWPQQEIKLELEKSKRLEEEDSTGNSLDVENTSSSSISIDSKIQDKSLLKMSSCLSPDMSTHNSLVINAECTFNEMLARYKTLTERVSKSRIVDSGDAMEHSGLIASPDLESDGMNADPPVSNAVGQGDDVEASVVARMDILKRRDENLIAKNMESPLPEAFALGSAIRSDYIEVNGDRIADRCLSENTSSVSMHGRAVSGHGKSTIKAQYGNLDDFVFHSLQKHGGGRPSSAGHQESASSEWEHVMKEDITGQVAEV